MWINDGKFNSQAILAEFKDNALFAGWFAPQLIKNGGNYLAVQENAIVINNVRDPDLLAWYAGHGGSAFDQLLDKLYGFFSFYLHNPELYRMVQAANLLRR